MKIDKRIIKFIKKHHVLTLATSNNNEPWCANCFYVYLEEENIFVFTSDTKTKHIQDSQEQNKVACSIVLETKNIGKIQGIQFKATIEKLKGNLFDKAKMAYLIRFPMSVLTDSHLWILHPEYIKMTDNRLGFGKKIIWDKKDLFTPIEN